MVLSQTIDVVRPGVLDRTVTPAQPRTVAAGCRAAAGRRATSSRRPSSSSPPPSGSASSPPASSCRRSASSPTGWGSAATPCARRSPPCATPGLVTTRRGRGGGTVVDLRRAGPGSRAGAAPVRTRRGPRRRPRLPPRRRARRGRAHRHPRAARPTSGPGSPSAPGGARGPRQRRPPDRRLAAAPGDRHPLRLADAHRGRHPGPGGLTSCSAAIPVLRHQHRALQRAARRRRRGHPRR